MTQLGSVPAIEAVQKHLNTLQERGLVQEWQLPYPEILTRLSAAIFFLTPTQESNLEEIWSELEVHERLGYRLNENKELSTLEWRVEFNRESAK